MLNTPKVADTLVKLSSLIGGFENSIKMLDGVFGVIAEDLGHLS